MMHSLEVRAPFLQHELVEFAFNLPDEYKTNRERGKLVLEKAFSDILPPDFFIRKKQGFGAPIDQWLRKNELQPLINLLLEPSAKIYTLMRFENVKSFIEGFKSGNKQFARRVWALLTLELWLKYHKESFV